MVMIFFWAMLLVFSSIIPVVIGLRDYRAK